MSTLCRLGIHKWRAFYAGERPGGVCIRCGKGDCAICHDRLAAERKDRS